MSSDEMIEAICISDSEHCSITGSFELVFAALSTWNRTDELTLEISLYSLSDAEHWFPYLTFMPDVSWDLLDTVIPQDSISTRARDEHQHDWPANSRNPRHLWDVRAALRKIFHEIMIDGPFLTDELEFEWFDQLPLVPAVTRLLLRQQTRRRWKPKALDHMLGRLPNITEFYYEPWREFGGHQKITDREMQSLFQGMETSKYKLKRLVVFENFNQQYPVAHQLILNGEDIAECDSFRQPCPELSRKIALTSFNLDQLSASFIADAMYFFRIEDCGEWPNLTSLVLTSKSLLPAKDPINLGAVLRAAATAALKMPRLQTMKIWNGRKEVAALFMFEKQPEARRATLTWKATWEWVVDELTIQAWEAVTRAHDADWRLEISYELVDKSTIRSHGDAIQHLMLSEVIRPISLRQIQIEQKALEGIPTVE